MGIILKRLSASAGLGEGGENRFFWEIPLPVELFYGNHLTIEKGESKQPWNWD